MIGYHCALQVGTCSVDECKAETGGPRLTWEPVDGLFIVRFKAYRMAAQHREELKDGLKDVQEHWQWVNRDNKAAHYPTDFGLLRISSGARQVVEVRCLSASCTMIAETKDD